MAKLQEQTIVIKISRLLRDNQTEQPFFDQQTIDSLESVVAELAGQSVMVEIVQDQ